MFNDCGIRNIESGDPSIWHKRGEGRGGGGRGVNRDGYENPPIRAFFRLRWLNRVFLRLNSARYHCLSNVSVNHAFTNDASSPKKKRNHFTAWKALNHFSISSNSFKLYSNMCLSLELKKYDKKISGKRALIYSCFPACDTWRDMSARLNECPRVIPRVFFWFLWRHVWKEMLIFSRFLWWIVLKFGLVVTTYNSYWIPYFC